MSATVKTNEAQVHELVLDLTNPEKVSYCFLVLRFQINANRLKQRELTSRLFCDVTDLVRSGKRHS